MNPDLAALADRQGGVFSYQDALACGYCAGQARKRVRDGQWLRLRRGQYTAILPDPAAPRWQRETENHRLRTIAAIRALDGSVAVSHQSAVVAHGLPVWALDLSAVHVTRRDGHTGRIVSGVVQHQGRLTDGAIWLRDNLDVVAPARAIIEVACTSGFEQALVVADRALHDGLVSRRALEFACCDAASWPGGPAARRVLDFCDGRSESVGESRLRVLMDREGLPAPDLQTPIRRDGDPFAFVDFYFGPPYNTVVEFDGRQKYGTDKIETVLREKRREDAIRELGHQFVRVVWADLSAPARTATRIRQAFARTAAVHRAS